MPHLPAQAEGRCSFLETSDGLRIYARAGVFGVSRIHRRAYLESTTRTQRHEEEQRPQVLGFGEAKSLRVLSTVLRALVAKNGCTTSLWGSSAPACSSQVWAVHKHVIGKTGTDKHVPLSLVAADGSRFVCPSSAGPTVFHTGPLRVVADQRRGHVLLCTEEVVRLGA